MTGVEVTLKKLVTIIFTLKYGIDMRKRFALNAVASSDGAHVRVSHDRRANATGRSNYTFLGRKVIITDGNVFRNGHWIGKCITDDQGNKFVSGPYNNGNIQSISFKY